MGSYGTSWNVIGKVLVELRRFLAVIQATGTLPVSHTPSEMRQITVDLVCQQCANSGIGNSPARSVSTSDSSCAGIRLRNQSCASLAAWIP